MVNRTRQELKTDYIDTQQTMLEVCLSLLTCYKKTKDERLFELYLEIKKDADSWRNMVDELNAL